MMNPSDKLRRILRSPAPSFLMEAHSPFAAKIVESEGFDGIWLSSFTMSSVLGKRDASEITWTETLDLASRSAAIVDVPILLDADNAFGDFNILRQWVSTSGRAGIAGCVFEDKNNPKINSFRDDPISLIPTPRFCGLIRAGKDSQYSESFCLVARTEALIAGSGLSEALDRSASYVDAGADAVLVHSKGADGSEIMEFLKQWRGYAPVILVPTTYHRIGTATLFEAGANVVVWANQLFRASVHAMRETARQVRLGHSLDDVQSSLASIESVFDLLDYDELESARLKYAQDDAGR